MSLHAVKYLTEDTIGLLVGQYEKNKIIIEDCYPLSHSRILAPTLEVAFQLVQAQLKDSMILGIYESTYLPLKENIITDISQKILSQIQEMIQLEPIVIKLVEYASENENNHQNDERTIDYQVSLYQKIGQNDFNLKLLKQNQIELADFQQIKKEIEKGSHRLIIDFDNHFENCELDFTNKFVQ